jgi:hypothetical protein
MVLEALELNGVYKLFAHKAQIRKKAGEKKR